MNTNTSTLRVSLRFGSGGDYQVEETASAVLANLYGNPAYETPPVTREILLASIQALNEAKVAQAQGGTAATALKNERRQALVALLKELASYVQTTAKNNLAMLLSSGFHATSSSRTRSALPKPQALRVKAGSSGQLLLTVKAVRNSRCYQIEVREIQDGGAAGPWRMVASPTSSRNMSAAGLVPGALYACRVRAVGGSTGFSDWTDVVVHRVL